MRRLTAIRWTLPQAAVEFGCDARFLAKRIKGEGIAPGKDKKWSTAQICQAVFGDIHGERLRKTKEEADKLALANSERRGELIPAQSIATLLQRFASSVREKILASPLPPEDRRLILTDLQALANGQHNGKPD